MSYNIENIKSEFKKINVDLVISKKPFAGGQHIEDIFQLDIRRTLKGPRRTEYFLLWPGHKDNTIQITAKSPKYGQLVLTVKEPKRTFLVELDKYSLSRLKLVGVDNFKNTLPRGQKLVRKDAKFYIQNTTPDSTRHYLLGLDERQLFIAELRGGATSMEKAFAQLKPTTVSFAEERARGKTVRQGEWFFLHPTADEDLILKEYLRSSTKIVYKKAPVGKFAGRTGGKPHIADELVTCSGVRLQHGFQIRPRGNVFVRGAIRHPDHETIKFASWRKVILNTEKNTGGPAGSTWID